MVCIAGTVIFAVFGQLLVIFYNTAATARLSASQLLSIHHQLSITSNHLSNCFAPILLISCVHIFVGFIFNSYAFLTEIVKPKLLTVAIWDGILATECCFRLWLICYTADSIRLSVCIIKYFFIVVVINKWMNSLIQLGNRLR